MEDFQGSGTPESTTTGSSFNRKRRPRGHGLRASTGNGIQPMLCRLYNSITLRCQNLWLGHVWRADPALHTGSGAVPRR